MCCHTDCRNTPDSRIPNIAARNNTIHPLCSTVLHRGYLARLPILPPAPLNSWSSPWHAIMHNAASSCAHINHAPPIGNRRPKIQMCTAIISINNQLPLSTILQRIHLSHNRHGFIDGLFEVKATATACFVRRPPTENHLRTIIYDRVCVN